MSEKLEKLSWIDDESICPCGKKAGPDFRYGLCDEHANACPPVALLRWGHAVGRAMTEVAAAEERGRRRGVEEAAKVCDHNEDHARDADGQFGERADAYAFAAKQIRALAPRDSAPARYCDEPHPSQALRCGRFVEHDGPHTAYVPGYEAEQRAAVHWETPRDSGKEPVGAYCTVDGCPRWREPHSHNRHSGGVE